MNILSTLRQLRRQVESLQANQKPKEAPALNLSSGMTFETDPLQNIDMLTYAVEEMQGRMIKLAERIIDKDY